MSDNLVEDIRKAENRISAVEKRVSALEIISAVETERFNSLINRLDRIDGHIGKLVWLVIAAILGAFMSFVIKGGLV